MPLSQYDRYYGGTKDAAAKAKMAMEAQYGEDKGESVFYAKTNKLKNNQQKSFSQRYQRPKLA